MARKKVKSKEIIALNFSESERGIRCKLNTVSPKEEKLK